MLSRIKRGMLKARLFGQRHKWDRVSVALAVVLVLTIGVVLSVHWWGKLHGPDDSLSTTIRSLGILIGGVIAVILTMWRSIVAERQAATAERQAAIAEQNVRLAQEQSLSDRYQQGAEMLGNKVLAVRLAGIYALANLSHQYPDRYHVPVIKLLCSFVRYPIEMDQHLRSSEEKKVISNQPALRADVQAALRAIADRDDERVQLEYLAGYVVDLQAAHLVGAELRSANLTRVNLDGANLSRAVFEYVDLSHVRLSKANLEYFYLLESKLIGANMQIADLSYALVQRTDLSHAWMPSRMIRTEILRSDLSWATFGPDDLTTLDITGSNLSGVQFGTGIQSTRHVSPEGHESFVDEQYFGKMTQKQLDKAFADPGKPPVIPEGMKDAETGALLTWRSSGPGPVGLPGKSP